MKTMNIRKKLVSLAVASAFGGGAMLAMTAPVVHRTPWRSV